MLQIWSDLRFASRILRAKPLFAGTAILSLALGIGANTAIFSIVESTMLRALPYRDATQLLIFYEKQPCCEQASVSPGEYRDYSSQTKTLSGLAAFTGQSLTLTGRSEPRQLRGIPVTTNFFDVLGARAELGRLISPAIDKPGASSRAAVISDSAWRSIFGADPDIIGRDIDLNGSSFKVVGVLAPAETYPVGTQVWISPRISVPEYMEGAELPQMNTASYYGSHWLVALGRMKPGVGFAEARGELNTIAARIARQHPGQKDHRPALLRLEDDMLQRDVRPAVWVLMAAVSLLLLIACANLAGLLLARSSGRTRELAVRLSLGATRSDIVRLLLSESLLLAVAGGALGILFASGALRLLAQYSPYDLPVALEPELNVPVLAFCVAVSIVSALLSGLLPAIRATRLDLTGSLKDASKGSAGRGTRRLRQILVSAEIAVSIMLLTGAGLLIRSFSNLVGIDPGFDPKAVLTAHVALPEQEYTDARATAFWNQLLTRLAAIPQVEQVGLMTHHPLSQSQRGSYLEIEGRPLGPHESGVYAREFGGSPGTFSALRVPLVAGRNFEHRDNEKAPLVVIVNQAFAHKLFPHGNPIGKRIRGGYGGDRWATIVGVAGDVKDSALDSQPDLNTYYNYAQIGVTSTFLAVRTKTASVSVAADLGRVVHSLDQKLPLTDVQPLGDYVGQSLASRQFLLALLSTFSGLALLLAGIGLYAVLAYSVEQRTAEIGIRMAIGATAYDVLGVVLRECFMIAAVGLVAGVVGAVWSSSFLRSMLFGVTNTDYLAYGSSVLVILAVAIGASLMPALRAAQVDPVSALRHE